MSCYVRWVACVSRLLPGISYYQATTVEVVILFRCWSNFTTAAVDGCCVWWVACVSRLVPIISYYQATIVEVVMCFRCWSKFTAGQRLGSLTDAFGSFCLLFKISARNMLLPSYYSGGSNAFSTLVEVYIRSARWQADLR